MQEMYSEFSQVAQAMHTRESPYIVQPILDGGELVNRARRNKNEITLLHLAVDKGEREIVKILLKKGFNVNAQDYSYSTPLIYANGVSMPDERITQLLLDNGADPNICNYWGETPLLKAARYYRPRDYQSTICIDALIRHGADIRARDSLYGYTALHYITAGKHYDDNDNFDYLRTMEKLLEKGAQVNATARFTYLTPLHIAATKGHGKIADFLLDHGANMEDLDSEAATPLHLAAKSGKADCVNLLLDRGANINARNRSHDTPLMLAIATSSLDTVKAILRHHPDEKDVRDLAVSLDIIGEEELAEKHPRVLIHEALVEYGFTRPGLGPVDCLWIAMARHDFMKQKTLRKTVVKSPVQALKARGSTPVEAPISSHWDRVKPTCNFEYEASHLFINQGMTVAVKTLLVCGIDPNQNWDHFARGPIDLLAYCEDDDKRVKIFRILVQYGIDFDSQGDFGTTLTQPLIWFYVWAMDRLIYQRVDFDLDIVCKNWSYRHFILSMHLIRHLNKLLTAGASVSDVSLYLVQRFKRRILPQLERYYPIGLFHCGFGKLCKKAYRTEVRRMKRHSLIDGISLHEIFITEDIEYRANQPLVDLLESVDFDKYEEYGNLLRGKLKRDKRRYELPYRAMSGFYSLVKHDPRKMLPPNLVMNIISQLSELDQQHLAMIDPEWTGKD